MAGLVSLQPNLSSAPAPALLDPGCADREDKTLYSHTTTSSVLVTSAVVSVQVQLLGTGCTYRQLIFI